MRSVSSCVAQVRARMARAARDSGRDPAKIGLLAVSKTRTAQEIDQAIEAGVMDIGENYLAEALPKIAALSERSAQDRTVHWHFIGAIQSNKTQGIATAFDWVHTVDRDKVARRLSQQRPADAPPLNVLLQVNVDNEPQKAGVSVDGLSELVGYVARLPRITLRGLMAIPRETPDAGDKRASFRRLAQLFEMHRPVGRNSWDTLSMGMSSDFELAIEEGATLIRVGTAIFGERS